MGEEHNPIGRINFRIRIFWAPGYLYLHTRDINEFDTVCMYKLDPRLQLRAEGLIIILTLLEK